MYMVILAIIWIMCKPLYAIMYETFKTNKHSYNSIRNVLHSAKLNLKQTPLQSIQVPINFKCPEYRGFTLIFRKLSMIIRKGHAFCIATWLLSYSLLLCRNQDDYKAQVLILLQN